MPGLLHTRDLKPSGCMSGQLSPREPNPPPEAFRIHIESMSFMRSC